MHKYKKQDHISSNGISRELKISSNGSCQGKNQVAENKVLLENRGATPKILEESIRNH